MTPVQGRDLAVAQAQMQAAQAAGASGPDSQRSLAAAQELVGSLQDQVPLSSWMSSAVPCKHAL